MPLVPLDDHDSFSGPLMEVRSISTAGTGTAITTTSSFILLPLGITWMSVTPRNLSTANMVQVSLCPWLVVLKTTDDLVTFTDYSSAANDNDTATDVTLSSLSTAAAADYLYVGSHLPFAGTSIDVDLVNGTASVITVKYWSSVGPAWVDISATDNTGGATSLANDGTITWTIPSAWTRVALKDTTSPTPTAKDPALSEPLYWTRWQWSAGLDSATTLNSIAAISRNVGAELLSGQTFETRVIRAMGGIGSLQAVVDSGVGGTANLVINVGVRPSSPGIGL